MIEELKKNKLAVSIVVLVLVVLFVSKTNFSVSDMILDKIADKVSERIFDDKDYTPYGPQKIVDKDNLLEKKHLWEVK